MRGGNNKIRGKRIEGVWYALKLYPHLSCREVAGITQVSLSTVRRVMRGEHPETRRFGKPKPLPKERKHLTVDQVYSVQGHYNSGLTPTQCSRLTGVSLATVNRIIDGRHPKSPVKIRR